MPHAVVQSDTYFDVLNELLKPALDEYVLLHPPLPSPTRATRRASITSPTKAAASSTPSSPTSTHAATPATPTLTRTTSSRLSTSIEFGPLLDTLVRNLHTRRIIETRGGVECDHVLIGMMKLVTTLVKGHAEYR